MYSIDQTEVEGMDVYVLQDSVTQATAKVVPTLGNNCFSFGLPVDGEWVDLIDPPPDLETLKKRPTAYGNPILFPFPNRIRGGEFTFEGKTYRFDKRSKSPTSIHGLLLNKPYRVESTRADDESATLICSLDSREFPEVIRQYPFPFELKITYTLKAAILTMDIEIENLGDVNMPMGFGIHPYFRVLLSPESSPNNVRITVPVAKYWELDEVLVPTGRILNVSEDLDLQIGKPFEGMKFDHVFTEVHLSNGVSRCIIDDQDAKIRLILEADAQFRELVVYTPPNRPSICFEPYTCPTDAINLETRGIDAGVIVLKPGEEFSGTIRIIPEIE
ncbi:MAG: aldose 1-epimerase [Candidatus Poribacteria bacterium]